MAASNVEHVQDEVGGNDAIDASAVTTGVTVYAGDGIDTVTGGSGNDMLSGGNGNDTLIGNDGSDQLMGDAGQDRLTGGAGNDSLFGGVDADAFVWTANGGTDTVSDWQDGIDTLEFNGVAGLDDFSDLTIAATDTGVEVFFGADKLFVLAGASHIGAGDCLFV